MIIETMSWAQLANARNPSYSRSRDQKACGSKPAWINSLGDTIQKILTKASLLAWLK
jgi:hypothetical protein